MRRATARLLTYILYNMQPSVAPAMNETDWISLFTNRTTIQELQETESIEKIGTQLFLDGQPEQYHVQIVTKFCTILVDVLGTCS